MAHIGVMDSGLGGLSVLREMLKTLPGCSYFYYADSANCPYGTKEPAFIVDRCREITRLFVDRGCSAVVVACNTATSAAISTLRAEFDIPFVGMEPAVKPAALGTRSGVVGVLATAGTLKGSKYLDIKDRYADGVTVVEHVGSGFVELVESLRLDGQEVEKVVAASLNPLLDRGADTVVLGCTHYPFLLPVMQRIAASRGADVRFIDPAPAVAARLKAVLPDGAPEACPEVSLLSSGDPAPLQQLYNNVINQ